MKTYRFWEALGIHLTPAHYHQPLPQHRNLRSSIWEGTLGSKGVSFNEEAQLELLSEFKIRYEEEFGSFPVASSDTQGEYRYHLDNWTFSGVDGEMLYSMIRYNSPKRIIEVGSGFSTRLIQQAIDENNTECEHIVIDPSPATVVDHYDEISLISEAVQEVPPSEFQELDCDDILFIDSSHVLKIGSDVQYVFLDVLPVLDTGVLVHFHDIFLPMEYPKEWVVEKNIFWNEQYVLQAFLTFNDAYEVAWASAYMHLHHPEKLDDTFKTYSNLEIPPGSFWMRRT